MGALDHSDTVEQHASVEYHHLLTNSCHQSHPGPVVGCRERVSQHDYSGKYFNKYCNRIRRLSAFSINGDILHVIKSDHRNISMAKTSTEHTNALPRRTFDRMQEVSNSPDSVAPSVSTLSSSIACSSHQSRLGPEVVVESEIFRNPQSGEYLQTKTHTLPDHLRCCSPSTYDRGNSRFSTAAVKDANENENLLTLYYQNVRGLRTKTSDLRLLLSSCDYDILVFTET